jgi:capsular exopolysaccharide synthesis family protein
MSVPAHTHPAAVSLGRAREADLSGDPAARLDEKVASALRPESFEADQYRVLRHFVDGARSTRAVTVVAVTSAAAGDGKTTTAVNLALTLGQTPGARVLLLEADLRRPLVARMLGLDADAPGLSELVAGDGHEPDAVLHHTPWNVAVLAAGRPPRNAYHVLESPRVARLLEGARSAYDYVVVDAPPVLLVPDCAVMERWVDGFLLVVAAHRTPRRLLAETLSAVPPEKVLGIVLNRDDRPLAGYYKQYYGGYHHARSAGRRPGWWSSAGGGEDRR